MPSTVTPKPNHILVQIVTTSGSWPPGENDFHEVPINQPVKVQLQKAAKELHLTNTDKWVARVGPTELDPNKSYAEQGLSGSVEIDYGPSEGGGGRE